ncbi:MAG: hypothetical protein A4E58_02286 [Syntrophorhabdus sp. PtaB.Bin006]|nr:MAG: hypothetical protein A4E58_02286 [Syntrophorhabdus sp. PtaB.Bin006]
MSMIPLRFHQINAVQPGTPFLRASRLFQTTVKFVSLKCTSSPFFQWLKHVHFPSGTFPLTLTVVSCHAITGTHVVPSTNISPRSLPHPQADMNLYRNRIPSTIPFPRQAPDLTRDHVPFRSTLKCEGNMVCWYSVVLRKERGSHSASPQSPFACAGPISGTPGTTHRHVTGPQVVPQCSLQEQPSVHAIRIFHRFYLSTQSLQTYLSLKESCSCTPTYKPLQKNIRTRFFLPDSHQWRGESGLSGRRHGRNVSDVDELRVLAGRRRTERTSEGARRSRSPQMNISIMPLTGQEKTKRCTYGDNIQAR